MTDCIFCKIVSRDAHSHILWENQNFVAILDINPINPGHTLLIPKEHCDYIFDLSAALYHELFQHVRILSGPLRSATSSERIGLAVEGFEVAHAHVHLVPLHAGDELDPHRAKPAIEKTLTAIADSIRSAISSGSRTG